ncbi:115aa long hypothetical protein [Pyrococcus horikoshii OT3]|uniref:Uncharacterized protein n=1 Tax=Pyrococcus horikoshii (strain ATCC 700860 / DSM 12428 / JCM 9974 / NBRC 100139 / OT-3) TaxID=70601 RepID=O57851_PYRHO|nr:115aa long hypothetical protein [Pyrococcus horikoshii OT3]
MLITPFLHLLFECRRVNFPGGTLVSFRIILPSLWFIYSMTPSGDLFIILAGSSPPKILRGVTYTQESSSISTRTSSGEYPLKPSSLGRTIFPFITHSPFVFLSILSILTIADFSE